MFNYQAKKYVFVTIKDLKLTCVKIIDKNYY